MNCIPSEYVEKRWSVTLTRSNGITSKRERTQDRDIIKDDDLIRFSYDV